MKWLPFNRRARIDAEQAQELESYLDIAADEYIARGMMPDAARTPPAVNWATRPSSARRFTG
jgi:hypothetical protein